MGHRAGCTMAQIDWILGVCKDSALLETGW